MSDSAIARASAEVAAAETRLLTAEAEARAAREALEAAQAARSELDKPAQELAEVMHRLMCKADHNDRCGWFYEKAWGKSEHSKWSVRARALLEILDADTAARVIALVGKY